MVYITDDRLRSEMEIIGSVLLGLRWQTLLVPLGSNRVSCLQEVIVADLTA